MFKLPTLTKLPQYKRFEYQPRYYDPVKEMVEEKIAAVKNQLEAEKQGNYDHAQRIKSSFRKRSRHERQKTDFSQSLFVLVFVAFFGLYFYFGNAALWLLAVLFPACIYFRLKSN